MLHQADITASTRHRWTPGEPWHPLSIEQSKALRSVFFAREAMAASDRIEAQQEADGLACPTCFAPLGVRCFGPDARCNHPVRAMAHWDARVQARAAA